MTITLLSTVNVFNRDRCCDLLIADRFLLFSLCYYCACLLKVEPAPLWGFMNNIAVNIFLYLKKKSWLMEVPVSVDPLLFSGSLWCWTNLFRIGISYLPHANLYIV